VVFDEAAMDDLGTSAQTSSRAMRCGVNWRTIAAPSSTARASA